MSQSLSNKRAIPTTANGAAVLIRGLAAGYADNLNPRSTIRLIAHGVDLDLAPGSISALVGGNGSGKSTILAAIVNPRFRAQGTVERNGVAVRSDEIAYMPQNSAATLFPWLDGTKNIQLWGQIHGSEATVDPTEIASRYGMTAPLTRRVTELSGGERVQVALLRALAVPGRKFFVLDEPVEGLDFSTRGIVLKLLKQIASEGTPVLLTSHRSEDLYALDASVYSLVGSPVNRLEPVPSAGRAWMPAPEVPSALPSPGAETQLLDSYQRPVSAIPLGIMSGLMFWWLISLVFDRPTLIPDPIAVARELWELGHSGGLVTNVAATAARATGAWILGLVVAIPLGTLLGYHKYLYSVLSPWLSLARTFPVFTLTGVAIGMFAGAPEAQRLFLIVLTVFFIAVQIVASAAFVAPRRRVELARIFGAGEVFCLTRVMFFEAIGGVLAALETTLPLAFVLTLVIESFLIPDVGIGRFVLNALQGASTATTLAVVLWPALIAAVGVSLIRRFGKSWRFEA